MNRTEVIEHRIKELEAELAKRQQFGEDEFPNGTVLKFKYRFCGEYSNTAFYTFVALKTADHWYLTGRIADMFTWDDLVEFLARGTVKKMRIATEWKAANE